MLNPGETKTIDVLCNPDEIQKFTDTLHIIVSNGCDIEVQLRVKGTGSTLYCKELMDAKEEKSKEDGIERRQIDFGTEYTYKNVIKQFFLENRGRKPMKIVWARQKKKEKKKIVEPNAPVKDNKSTKEKEPEELHVFSVTPADIVLNAKMGIMVEIRANSTQIGSLAEQWECQTLVGNERKPKPVYFANIFGNFITPTLKFDPPKLDFKYLWQKGIPSMPISKELKITNTSPLVTTISLKIE